MRQLRRLVALSLPVILTVIILATLCTGVLYLSESKVHAGTPTDNYTIERYYTEAISTVNTTSTTYQDAATLTFTPPVTKDYLILATALTNNSDINYSTIVQLDINGTGCCETYHKPVDVTRNWRSFGTHTIQQLTGGQQYTIKIQYRTENAAGTAYIQRAVIAVMEVANYYNEEANSENTTTETGYVDMLSLTFTPPEAAEYLILYSCNIRTGTEGKDAFGQFSIDGAADSEIINSKVEYMSWGAIESENLTAAPYTFTFQLQASSPATAYIKNARISAVLMTDFRAERYAEAEAETATQSTTYVDKTTLTYALSTRADHLIIGSGLGNQEDVDEAFYAQLLADGGSEGEYVFVPGDSAIYRSFMLMRKKNLSAASHTHKIQYKTSLANKNSESFIKNANLIAICMNSAESYSDSGHVTVDDDFTSTQTAIYIWAHGLKASSSYEVGYYDANETGGGQRVTTADSQSSTAYGNLASSYTFSTNTSATAGTWRAVVFDSAYGSPPQNYNDAATTAGYQIEDSFTVQAGAITPPSISNTPESFNFGLLSEGSTANTTLTYFEITNDTAYAVRITISGTDMIGGVTWELSDSATPDTDTFGLKAGLEGGSYNVTVKKTATFDTLINSLAGEGTTQRWGLKIWAPTIFSDGGSKSGNVTLTAAQT